MSFYKLAITWTDNRLFKVRKNFLSLVVYEIYRNLCLVVLSHLVPHKSHAIYKIGNILTFGWQFGNVSKGVEHRPSAVLLSNHASATEFAVYVVLAIELNGIDVFALQIDESTRKC